MTDPEVRYEQSGERSCRGAAFTLCLACYHKKNTPVEFVTPSADAAVARGGIEMFRGGWLAFVALLVTHAASGGETGALAQASMEGDVPAMNAQLKKHADPNAPGPFGTPALHWRVHVDDVAGAKRLLKAGAD